MSKTKKRYSCSTCGSIVNKWSGQCFDCGAWGSINEEAIEYNLNQIKPLGTPQVTTALDANVANNIRIITAIEELNRVLGGGLVTSSAILIGGDPGIGKSTLLLQLAASLTANKIGCLYVTGEESPEQIKLRALRLGIANNSTNILAATNIEDIIATIDSYNNRLLPQLEQKNDACVVIIDSIQTMSSNSLSAAAGTVSQIRACTFELIDYAKHHNIILLLACHVTKDGQLAGPKMLEHMVDTVLYFEGDYNNHFRILRSIKNRFGSVNEIGVFEMTALGLQEVPNPSELFLSRSDKAASGSAVFAGIEGSRALLIEIQALIAPSHMAMPRRSVVGWDVNRLSMMIAVLNVRFGLNLSAHEVYLTIAGGLRITEPATDLAVAAALISAATNIPIPPEMVFFGEVALSGEIRKVTRSEIRGKEAMRMGFNQIICAGYQNNPDDHLIRQIVHLKQLKSIIS
ncbi:DNA repair protein RadA [Candidatus Trichorickettsia mobilis]|uniref:DNA repair protein RadA n=1 Tax=Candidatus Trichorickettsia mobilis TaxID=1346319 RepID=UPI00292EBB33|nr:DNA repair protein RadA [Candidatus Trichorickettsia mobilis]